MMTRLEKLLTLLEVLVVLGLLAASAAIVVGAYSLHRARFVPPHALPGERARDLMPSP